MSALPSRVTSCPSSRIAPSVGSMRRSTVRATVDLPQPLSPTRPKVSPSPTVRRNTPFLTGKCFFRLTTASTGARLWPGPAAVSGPAMVATSLSIEPLGMPAGGPVARALLLVGRIEGSAAIVGERAARGKRAARRQIGQGRHQTGDLLQPAIGFADSVPADDRQLRDRGEEAMR